MEELEKEIMELIVQAHNKYMQLNPTHPSDANDWINGIHKIQDVLGRRLLRRDYPRVYVSYTICPHCKGTGLKNDYPCSLCDGKGNWINTHIDKEI